MAEPGRPRTALALVHYPVRDKAGGVQATAVTPLNVHDLARLARTYGLAPFYVVTPLLSQRALIERILHHWREGHGARVNPTRREALRDTVLADSVNEVLADLLRLEGAPPLLVSTGAREVPRAIGYGELATRIAAPGRPWLLLFGTGWGLAPELTAQCDYFLEPVRGRGEFNHLSVRTAVAIILDRLFGK